MQGMKSLGNPLTPFIDNVNISKELLGMLDTKNQEPLVRNNLKPILEPL